MNASTKKYSLVYIDDKLALQENLTKNSQPICVDFLSKKLLHRQKFGGGLNQLLVKAVGIKKLSDAQKIFILDATAGLGTDSFVLATLGAKVHMLERSPIIGELLKDGLKRFLENPELQKLKLTLTITDAISFLNTTKEQPDVIYLDPMYPERQKSALGKKEMRILKEIVGTDNDAAELFAKALKVAKKRIVVKRPKLAPTISVQEPDLIIKGKSSRFDVYFACT